MKIKTSFRKVDVRKPGWKAQAERNMDILKAQDARAKEQGTLVGRFISEPVADGRALYVITAQTHSRSSREVPTGHTNCIWKAPHNLHHLQEQTAPVSMEFVS
jgi:hypothetical protein